MRSDIWVPIVVATIIVVGAIVLTQTVRFGCIDLGFYKSCGVSLIK